MKKKRKKKKTSCLGLFLSFIATLVCLAITGVVLFMVFVVLTTDDQPIDPLTELKGIPEKLQTAGEWAMQKVQQGGEAAAGSAIDAETTVTEVTE